MSSRGSSVGALKAAGAPGDLAQAAERLAVVLREENAALKDMEFARAGGLLTAKCAAADALEASLRAATSDAQSEQAVETFYDEVVDCLAPLVTENQELHRRSARLQKRVHALVERLAARAGGRPRHDATPARIMATA